MISVIVRAKNEEAWIRRCLAAVRDQRVEHEVEVVLVDNQSTDLTVAKARSVWPDLTVVTIEEFLPGKALNLGIEASSGGHIVCLSAHCIPADDGWLAALSRNLEDGVAGVYGRQIPMASTSASDRRDLAIAFGLDWKVQHKDPFFHNANSIIPRAVLDEFPFRGDVTNIEDRLWAEQVLKAGLTIVYEPDARVFHHHGIHHGNDSERAQSTVRVLEATQANESDLVANPDKHLSQLSVVGIFPVGDRLGNLRQSDLAQLLEAARKSVEESRHLDGFFVSPASASAYNLAKSVGFDVLEFSEERPSEGSARFDDVLQYELLQMEQLGRLPDGILSFDLSYPFRPDNHFDDLIAEYAMDRLWSVCAGFPEYRPAWVQEDQGFTRLDVANVERAERDPLWIAVPGLGCVSTPSQVRSGRRLGDVTKLLNVVQQNHRYEVRCVADLAVTTQPESIRTGYEFFNKLADIDRTLDK